MKMYAFVLKDNKVVSVFFSQECVFVRQISLNIFGDQQVL